MHLAAYLMRQQSLRHPLGRLYHNMLLQLRFHPVLSVPAVSELHPVKIEDVSVATANVKATNLFFIVLPLHFGDLVHFFFVTSLCNVNLSYSPFGFNYSLFNFYLICSNYILIFVHRIFRCFVAYEYSKRVSRGDFYGKPYIKFK